MEEINSETDSYYTSYWRDWPLAIDYFSYQTSSSSFVSSKNYKSIIGVMPDPHRASSCPLTSESDRSSGLDSDIALCEKKSLEIMSTDGMQGFRKASNQNFLLKLGHWCTGRPLTQRFISSRGNEYFCEIDEDYLTDRFNLTGLNTEVQYYQYALDLIMDVFEFHCDDKTRELIEKSARHLYGLVHARYIVTTRGLTKMLEKYKKGDFGKCRRVMCESHPLLPMGQSDVPNTKPVKLYCAKCEDIYNPKSTRHSVIDGAYFGTSFHNIILQVYPALIPSKSANRYIPCIYGFKVHAPATLVRWQSGRRDEMRMRLRDFGIDSGFKDEEATDAEDSEDEYDEEEVEVDMDATENAEMRV